MFKWLLGGKGGGAADEPHDEGTAEVVVVSRKVALPRQAAFAAFVDRLTDWWPRDLTWAGDSLDTVAIDATMNGKATEKSRDGTVTTWGTVLSVNRPEHIVIAWQIGPDRAPAPSEATASRLDVRFIPTDDGGTEVMVVHRDFPRHGDGWQAYRATMGGKTGWPRLIGLYAKSAGG
jgi:uncharacterized protein YndB with AHSA1/START domain